MKDKKVIRGDKKLFTIAKRGGSEEQNTNPSIVRGVYTNKKLLFEVIESTVIKNGFDDVSFVDVYGYGDKKFNYQNVSAIVRVLNVNDSFSLKLTNSKTGETVTIEITLFHQNQETFSLK